MLTHVDLFSGIGGFALAAEWAGFETVVFCEKDEYCQKVLRKHWPGVPIIPEIRDFKWPMADTEKRKSREPKARNGRQGACGRGKKVTLLTGGFPCQPFSVAGKRRGKEDDRFLWPEMFAVISEVRPTWVIAENVAGIVPMELDKCLSDLESEGYETEAFIIPACAVEAKHRRDRVWIVGYSESARLQRNKGKLGGNEANTTRSSHGQDVADSQREGLERTEPEGGSCPDGCPSEYGQGRWKVCRWPVEPDVGRVAHGVPSRVDRLKSLGNAIVPQVAYEIIRAIRMIEEKKAELSL